MQSQYAGLDNATAQFLESHSRTVYIAFGQNAVPTDSDVAMIMHGLLTLMEEGLINGVLWARLNTEKLSKIKTDKHGDLMAHPDFFFIPWATQYAILAHKSTLVFISHGGAASMHEALYNRVRLFVYPFYGDQPANARAIERIGVGKRMNTMYLQYDEDDYALFQMTLREIVVDKGNNIQKKVNRFSAYVQLSASSAVRRGADVMEESLFASDEEGLLYYRQDAGYEIHWIKRHDIDVYVIFSMIGFLFWLLFNIIKNA